MGNDVQPYKWLGAPSLFGNVRLLSSVNDAIFPQAESPSVVRTMADHDQDNSTSGEHRDVQNEDPVMATHPEDLDIVVMPDASTASQADGDEAHDSHSDEQLCQDMCMSQCVRPSVDCTKLKTVRERLQCAIDITAVSGEAG